MRRIVLTYIFLFIIGILGVGAQNPFNRMDPVTGRDQFYLQQEDKLNGLRQQYASANQQGKEKLTPAILDLEQRILQMNEELDALGVSGRNAEKTKSK